MIANGYGESVEEKHQYYRFTAPISSLSRLAEELALWAKHYCQILLTHGLVPKEADAKAQRVTFRELTRWWLQTLEEKLEVAENMYSWGVERQASGQLFEQLQRCCTIDFTDSYHDDPVFSLYETFLGHYDARQRAVKGVYYTPSDVVHFMIQQTHQLLIDEFGLPLGLADTSSWEHVAQVRKCKVPRGVVASEPFVKILDPATGSGAFICQLVSFVRDVFLRAHQDKSPHELAQNWHAFLFGSEEHQTRGFLHRVEAWDVLEAPLVVTRLRLHHLLGNHEQLSYRLPSDYLLPVYQKDALHQHQAAFTVIIGNPPYRRESKETGQPKNWVRQDLLQDYKRPVQVAGFGKYFKNAYNTYVYFWRWAEWQVSNCSGGHGIIAFITPSSYLKGEAFIGLRQIWREKCLLLFVTDLEGNLRGFRKTANVFDIQTPIAIAHLVLQPNIQFRGFYQLIAGNRQEKLAFCRRALAFDRRAMLSMSIATSAPFVVRKKSLFDCFLPLQQIFPWIQNGVKVGRTWPISYCKETLWKRIHRLVQESDKGLFFKESPSGRRVIDRPFFLPPNQRVRHKMSIAESQGQTAADFRFIPYAYRAFDTAYMVADSRFIDRPSPSLWLCHSDQQVYFAGIMKKPNVCGPSWVATRHIPDLDFLLSGGKDVVPMYRDRKGSKFNINKQLVIFLRSNFHPKLEPDWLFYYTYAVLAGHSYARRFTVPLRSAAPRVPLTKNRTIFAEGVRLGKQLLHIETQMKTTVGKARLVRNATTSSIVPEKFICDSHTNQILFVCSKTKKKIVLLEEVPDGVFGFSVSGLQVVQSWLARRTLHGSGRRSSELDQIRPPMWSDSCLEEVEQLIWTLEASLMLQPQLESWLEQVLNAELWSASELPKAKETERKAPRNSRK